MDKDKLKAARLMYKYLRDVKGVKFSLDLDDDIAIELYSSLFSKGLMMDSEVTHLIIYVWNEAILSIRKKIIDIIEKMPEEKIDKFDLLRSLRLI